jgi:TPR repeat protein
MPEAMKSDLLKASQGDACAQNNLGLRFLYGRGVARDLGSGLITRR